MEISKQQFSSVISNLDISKEVIESLWVSLENQAKKSKNFNISKLFFYFGAFMIISAMTWLMNLSWYRLESGTLLIISFVYVFIFTLMGIQLKNRKDLKILSALFITIAVCMIPLVIYTTEIYLSIWSQDQSNDQFNFFYFMNKHWILMELGTILAGLIALKFFPFTLLSVPIFFSAWFFTLDIFSLLFQNDLNLEQKEWVSTIFGLGLIFISYRFGRKSKINYSYCGYFFGSLIFWTSLTGIALESHEFNFFIYFMINFMLMISSVVLRKRFLMVFGVLGSCLYLFHLAHIIFNDVFLFPLILSFIGLSIMYFGFLYQRNIEWIEKIIFNKIFFNNVKRNI